jgi:nitrite reductase/ring-hydroxylating ferredoxin subunit
MNERSTDFIEVARLEEIAPGTSSFVRVAGRAVALFNVGGSICAIDDRCAHQGQSLAAGRLRGKVVTCRAHGWRYDVTTGCLMATQDFGVACYRVQVVDGRILVAVRESPAQSADASSENAATRQNINNFGLHGTPPRGVVEDGEQ